MGDVVALAALCEFGHHRSRMRNAVAPLALRHSLMLVLVAGYAGYILMFGITVAQQTESLAMAGTAHLVGGVGCIGNCSRHMSLVATLAVSSNHIGTVRLVALGALRNLAVDVVAETAGQFGMLAGDLLEFDDLLSMAAHALFGDIVGQFDDLGSMRIVMATQTVCQLVVRLAGMAHAALGDVVLDSRTVAAVAVLAGHRCLVFASIGSNVGRWIGMALDTVCGCQHRLISTKGSNGKHANQRQ